MSRGARKAPLPNVRVGDRNLQAFLDGVRERLEVGDGERPRQSPLDQYVRRRDLTQDGGKTWSLAPLAGGGSGSPGGGGGDFIGVTPLSGLTATAAIETVILVWGGTEQPGYAYTEVWRATVDDLGQAVFIGQTPAKLFADDKQVSIGTTYYYWIRPVSRSGHPGPFNAVAGTPAAPGKADGTAIAALAVDTIHIANAAIVSANVAAAAIHSAAIQNAAITYAKIADAAVDTAKIATAAITNAKIGDAAVSTLKIAGNAVTVPAGASSSSVQTRENGADADWNTIVSVTLDSLGQPVSILGAVGFEVAASAAGGSGDDSSATVELRLRRGGTTIWSSPTYDAVASTGVSRDGGGSGYVGTGTIGTEPVAHVDQSPPSGSNTYSLQRRLTTTVTQQGPTLEASSYASAGGATLVAMGLKR